MRLTNWYQKRGARFVIQRARSLLDRYGVSPSKAIQRINHCVALLAEYGCHPPLFTPGSVVQHYTSFIRHLRDSGAEIAVHSYDHIDLLAIPPFEACQQLRKAAQTFAHFGIEAHGFRCPYLGCNDELANALPKGMFSYSSNSAVSWESMSTALATRPDLLFDTLNRFYKPFQACDRICEPWTRADLIEITVCIPDDLQLKDGLSLNLDQVARIWAEIFIQTHKRGELFTVIFHPELAANSEDLFGNVLQTAKDLQPAVCIAPLREISDWWNVKSSFRTDVSTTVDGLCVSFDCTARATILAKCLGSYGSDQVWDGTYYQVATHLLQLPAEPHPFVGLPTDTPAHVVSFLQTEGYILDTASQTASKCSAYIDSSTLAQLPRQVDLIEHIERLPGPLIRYWRWPNAAKSALAITGDLDALTLLDYAYRLFTR